MNRITSTELPLDPSERPFESVGGGLDYEPDHIKAGELLIYPKEFAVFLDGQQVEMPFKEFRLIVLLAQNYGRIVTRQKIVNEVWEGVAPGRTVDVHMARLRSRLPVGSIQTVVKVGYRLVAR